MHAPAPPSPRSSTTTWAPPGPSTASSRSGSGPSSPNPSSRRARRAAAIAWAPILLATPSPRRRRRDAGLRDPALELVLLAEVDAAVARAQPRALEDGASHLLDHGPLGVGAARGPVGLLSAELRDGDLDGRRRARDGGGHRHEADEAAADDEVPRQLRRHLDVAPVHVDAPHARLLGGPRLRQRDGAVAALGRRAEPMRVGDRAGGVEQLLELLEDA